MKNASMFCLAIVFVISCTKEEQMNEPPIVPPHAGLDLNSDGVLDYEIQYGSFVIDGVGFSRYGHFGRLEPLDDNEILMIEDSSSVDIAVRKESGGTLRVTPESPEKWLARSIQIIDITSKTETIWPDVWEPTAPFSSSNPTYIGIKINHPNVSIGWILIETSENTGEISVIESMISSSESLVIDPS